MEPGNRAIPIFLTNGEVGAYLVYPYLFNPQGEWIGWVTQDRNVYSVLGMCIGYMSDDPRILRKREPEYTYERQIAPGRPRKFYPPAIHPLAPMMPELPYDTIDVLMEDPRSLHTVDTGELRPDLD